MSQYFSKFLKTLRPTPQTPKEQLLKSKKLKALYKAGAGAKKDLSELDVERIESLTGDNISPLYNKGYYSLKFHDLAMLSNEQIAVLNNESWVYQIKPRNLKDFSADKIKFMISKAACNFYSKRAEIWEVSLIYDLYIKSSIEPSYQQIDLTIVSPLLIELYKEKIGKDQELAAKNLMCKFIGKQTHIYPILKCFMDLAKWKEANELTNKFYFNIAFVKIFEELLGIKSESEAFTEFLDEIITGLRDLRTNPEYLQKAIEKNEYAAGRIIHRLKETDGVKPPYKLDFQAIKEIEELFEGVEYNDNVRDPFDNPGLAILCLGGPSGFFGELEDMGCCIS